MKTTCMRPSEMFAHWEQVRQGLIELLSLYPEEELSYVPFPNSWPVGRIFLHIADTEDYWLHALVQETLPVEVEYPYTPGMTRQQITDTLAAAHDRTLSLLERLDDKDLTQHYRTPDGEVFTLYWIIWHVLEHEIHHRGELSLILGLLGRQGLDV